MQTLQMFWKNFTISDDIANMLYCAIGIQCILCYARIFHIPISLSLSLSILYLFHSPFSSAHFRLLLALELRKICYRMNVTHKQALNFLLVSFSFCVLLYTYKRWCNTSSLWCKFSEKLCIYESVFVRIQCAGAYNA